MDPSDCVPTVSIGTELKPFALRAKRKGPAGWCVTGPSFCALLSLRNVFSLKAFRPLLHLKLHKLAFVQRLVPIQLDGGKVNEDVLPRLALNEPKPLRCLEPLDHTLFSSQSSYSCSSDVPIRMLVTPAGRTAEPAPRWSCTPPQDYKTASAAGFFHKSKWLSIVCHQRNCFRFSHSGNTFKDEAFDSALARRSDVAGFNKSRN